MPGERPETGRPHELMAADTEARRHIGPVGRQPFHYRRTQLTNSARCAASVPGGLVIEDSQGMVRMTDMQGNVQAV